MQAAYSTMKDLVCKGYADVSKMYLDVAACMKLLNQLIDL